MLQNYSTWRVARVFFDEPDSDHYLREISRKSDLSHTSVKNHLDKLIEKDIVGKGKEKRANREFPVYRAELENDKYKSYKRIDLLSRLRSSGLIEFLVNEFQPNCIFLFGSASRGEDIEDSDIDLYLQAPDKEIEFDDFERTLKRKVQIHANEEFEKYSNELKNNILNGIKLYGFLEVFE